MNTSKIVSWVVVVVVILGAWYLIAHNTTTPATSPTNNIGLNGSPNQNNKGTPPTTTPVVGVATDATLGTHLVGANGMTLYTYSRDTLVSNCTGTCSANWPPYIINNQLLTATAGVNGALATIVRDDGSMQLTYKGAPVYYYSNDSKPGDVTGQNVGGVWFIVKP